MQIFVNTFIDQQLTLDVEATNTVADVKAKIQDMMRLPVARQRLIFADAVMQDDKTLADVEDKSVLALEFVNPPRSEQPRLNPGTRRHAPPIQKRLERWLLEGRTAPDGLDPTIQDLFETFPDTDSE